MQPVLQIVKTGWDGLNFLVEKLQPIPPAGNQPQEWDLEAVKSPSTILLEWFPSSSRIFVITQNLQCPKLQQNPVSLEWI